MSEGTKLRSVRPPKSCPYCHDTLGESPHVCPGCAAAYHPECWRGLAGCATLGCDFVRPPAARGPLGIERTQKQDPQGSPSSFAWTPLRFLLAGSIVLCVVAGMGLYLTSLVVVAWGLEAPKWLQEFAGLFYPIGITVVLSGMLTMAYLLRAIRARRPDSGKV